LAFLDEEGQPEAPPEPERPRREPSGPERKRQQYLVRRLIAVGVGVGFLILLVIGFRGCLEARSDRGLRNYTQAVGTIMQESQQRGTEFFDALQNSGGQSEDEVERTMLAIRGANAQLLDRAQSVDTPDQMRDAQSATTLSLKLRADALELIAANIGQATADAERADPIDVITTQMGSLYASDILWAQLASPEITNVLEDEGVEVPELPAGNFMPENNPTDFLDQASVSELLTGISGDDTEVTGLRGLELVQTSMGDVTLDGSTTVEVPSDAREVTVQVLNGGEVEETGVEVIVSLNGDEVTETISAIAAGATEEVNLNLGTVPQPGTEAALDVLVEPVTGETVTDNNEAAYTIIFSTG
jgi:hypothetical protein